MSEPSRASKRLPVAVVTLFAGVLAALASSRMYPYLPPFGGILAGILPGVVVGVMERTRMRAAVVAAVSSAVMLSTGAYLGIPVAAIVAWLVRGSARRDTRIARDRLLAFTLAFVILGGALAGVYSARQPRSSLGGVSLARWMRRTPDLSRPHADSALYLRFYQLEKGGLGYYDAVYSALAESHPDRPVDRRGAINFRLPLPFVVWASAPLSPLGTFVGGLLVLGAASAAMAYALGRRLGPSALALATASCVLAYFSSASGDARVLFVEYWTGALVLCSLSAWALHRDRDGDRWWLGASVLCALLAALTREIAAFVLVAGLAAAVVGDRRSGRSTWIPWTLAGAVFLGAYWKHVAMIGGGLFNPSMGPSAWLAGGVPLRLLLTWTEGDSFLPSQLLGLVFTLAVIASVFAIRDSSLRVFAILVAVVPTLLFGVVGTVGTDGLPLGYWGAIVKPALWALLPAVYLVIRWRIPSDDVWPAGASPM